MHELPPSIKNALHPDDLIPFGMREPFLAHLKSTYYLDNADQFDNAVKSMSPSLRETIKEIYQSLSANGWFPAGIIPENKGKGTKERIKWRYRVSIPQDLTGLENIKTADHAGNAFRRLLGGIGKRVDSLPEWEKEMCR